MLLNTLDLQCFFTFLEAQIAGKTPEMQDSRPSCSVSRRAWGVTGQGILLSKTGPGPDINRIGVTGRDAP